MNNKKGFIIFSVIVVAFAVLMVLVLELTTLPSSKDSKNDLSKKNIQVLSSHFGDNLAKKILLVLEETHILKENTQLDSELIVKRTEQSFEIYTDFSAIIIVNNDQFKILTYETVFDESTAILLYDSTTPNEMKALSEAERENLKSSQRKYQVQNTIRLSPQFGALLHNQWGQTFFSFTVKNVSDSDIVYMEFQFALSFPGYTSGFKAIILLGMK